VGILETTTASLGKCASAGGGDNDIIRVLLENLITTASGRVTRDLASNLNNTVGD
jgi:hypothetical protein